MESWRLEQVVQLRLRLSRMPTRDDPFGSHSMMLWQDQCDAFNLTEEAQETCGVYVNETGLLLKAEIDEQPEVDMVHGRLTTALTMKVVNNSGTFSAGPNTPSSGNFMQTFTPRECPVAGCPQPAKGPDGYNLLRRWSDASGWPDGQLPGEMASCLVGPKTRRRSRCLAAGARAHEVESDSTTLMLDVALVHRHFAGTVDSRGLGTRGGRVCGIGRPLEGSSDTHWPQPTLAAAVALLEGRSNVIFRTGEEVTEHGGEVVIAGSADGNWEGVANISNVDFLKMGKHWYQAPALKFNFLAGQTNLSRVENCVFSQSQSGAIEANSVSNLEIIGNVFHRTFRTAIWIRDTSADDVVIIRKNIAIETLRHSRENTDWVRHFGAFYMEVRPGELSGNVAAGSCDTGFILRPQLAECQKGDVGKPRLQQDELNEAVATLPGGSVLPGGSGWVSSSWMRARRSAMSVPKSTGSWPGNLPTEESQDKVLPTLTEPWVRQAIDQCSPEVGLRFVRSSPDMSHRIYSYNMSVFGSTPASTCDASIDCRALGREDVVGETCNSVIGNSFRRVGIMTHMINNLPKLCEMGKLKVCRPPTTPVKLCVMPWEHRLGSAGSRYSEAHWDAITFGHWSASDCGRPSAAFTYNPTNIDTAYPQLFTSVKWLPSVEAAAKVFLGESRATGNRVSMSPDFDGTSQMALTDVDGTLLGTTSADASLVTVYNPALALQTCQEQGSSFYDCPDLQLRYLTWEAVGGPAHRVLSKMKLWRASDDRSTWSAGPQPELGCIPADADKDRNFKVRPNEEYNLTMFTSPPKHHRLFWFNDNPERRRSDSTSSCPSPSVWRSMWTVGCCRRMSMTRPRRRPPACRS
ncbi:unnamed protein product [Effrenium voratum]|nr:unnamed protein product [Effrenium voratum]